MLLYKNLTIQFLETDNKSLVNAASGIKFIGRYLSKRNNTKGEKIRGYMQAIKLGFNKMISMNNDLLKILETELTAVYNECLKRY